MLVYTATNGISKIKDFYEHITLKLLTEKSCKIAGINQVDITREFVPIIQLQPYHWLIA